MRHAPAAVCMLLAAACGRVSFDDLGPGLGDGEGDGDAGFLGAARCPADVLLCEDFEAAQVDSTRWTEVVMSGTLGLDPTRAARGSQSLHVTGTGTALVRDHLVSSMPAGLPATTFVRQFVYVTAFASSTETWSWISDVGHSNGVQLEAKAPVLQLDGWGVSGAVQASATAMPIGRWVCLEWELQQGQISVWLDDTPLAGLQGVGWTTPAAPTDVFIGLQYQQPSGGTIDAWIDEVIVDAKRVGCTK